VLNTDNRAGRDTGVLLRHGPRSYGGPGVTTQLDYGPRQLIPGPLVSLIALAFYLSMPNQVLSDKP